MLVQQEGASYIEVVNLIQLQFAIECIGLDSNDLLVRIPGPDPDEISRVYVFQHERGYTMYFRQDLPSRIRRKIHDLGAETAFHHRGRVKRLLQVDAPCAEVGQYRTYVFPSIPGSSQFPDVIRLHEGHRPLIEEYHAGMDVTDRAIYAVIRDGKIVSTCASSRENNQAGEAYVFTVEEYRRRGYGCQVTAAWGHHLLEQSKVTFYSHAWNNVASRSVARALKLVPRFATVCYS